MSVETKQIDSLKEFPSFSKEVAGETFSANYVIHAYEQGVEKGKIDKMMELETIAKNQFIKNRDYVVETAFNLVAEMIADGIDIERGWIKSEITNDFDVMIAVPQISYYSENFEKFYVKINELEILSNAQDLHLNIRYINNDKPISEKMIYADGYNLKFDIKTSPKTINKK